MIGKIGLAILSKSCYTGLENICSIERSGYLESDRSL